MISTKAVFFLLFVTFLSQVVWSQQNLVSWDNGIPGIYKRSFVLGLSGEDAKKMGMLWDKIGKDIENEKNDLSGTYAVTGYDNGYFLRFSKSDFILIPYFDENMIADFSHGGTTFKNDSEVIFDPIRDLVGYRSFKKMPHAWIPLWDSFVPVESINDFFMFNAGLGKYNEFNGQCCEWRPYFLAAKVDRGDKKIFYPTPTMYESRVKRPVEGKLIYVGRKKIVKEWGFHGQLYGQQLGKTSLTPVRINVGREQGVKKNMLLHIVGHPRFSEYVQVTGVGANISNGFVVREFTYEGKEEYWDVQTDKNLLFPKIFKGDKVTSNPTIDN